MKDLIDQIEENDNISVEHSVLKICQKLEKMYKKHTIFIILSMWYVNFLIFFTRIFILVCFLLFGDPK